MVVLSLAPARAQDAPLVLEIQGGAVIPFGNLKEGTGVGEGTSAGPSLAVAFTIPGDGWRTLYAGFSQHRLGCEAAGCPSDGRYVATGFNVGIRAVLVQDHRAVPWLRVGAITSKVETGDLGASPASGVSDVGFGGEAGVGLLVQLGRSLAWTSAANVTLPGGSTLALRYLTAHTGLSLLF